MVFNVWVINLLFCCFFVLKIWFNNYGLIFCGYFFYEINYKIFIYIGYRFIYLYMKFIGFKIIFYYNCRGYVIIYDMFFNYDILVLMI